MLALRTLPFDLMTPFENTLMNEPRRWRWQCFSPSADVREDQDGYVIELDIPGLTEKEIEVTLENRHLTLRSERKPVDGANYTRQERSFGRFERIFHLPEDADTTRVEARARNGVLTVSIPKLEQARARTIEIKAE
ncbi:MAG: Hsp20/alpha crystallin family protein [Myxococcales bacterium]|jgi:HSP20 family protein